MKVLLITSWGTPCGIAEHSAMLVDAAMHAAGDLTITPCGELNPAKLHPDLVSAHDVIHLNYQAALHSQWTPEWIARCGKPVLVTYHDSGVPNSAQCQAICAAADYFVLHEPFDDLPSHGEYLRMGVADWVPAYQFDTGGRPLLGTVGFPFPWKCYDELARVTRQNGWDLLLLAPGATPEDEARWKALNPRTTVCPTFLDRRQVVSWLGGCDATAFSYVTHNTGQSGAILQGIAARKPVIALSTCRQNRALLADPLGRATIRWAENFTEIEAHLHACPIQRVDPGIVALAAQESWSVVGARYSQIYRALSGAA